MHREGYTRDVQGRIIERVQKEDGNTVGAVAYSFTGASDTPDFLLDAEGNIKHKYVSLPGDVLITIKTDSQSAGDTIFSLPNIHGDVFATVNADGTLMSTHISGPFGERLSFAPTQPQGAAAPSESPLNTEDGTTWGYLGQHEKLNEIEVSPIDGGVTQMGARVYLPTLGRFLQVDPIDGGTDNAYVYANDPVNQADITGNVVETIVDIAAIGYDASQLYSKPSWGNAGLLAWSVAATFVPFVPGSYVYRAGKSIKAAAPKMTKSAITVVPRKAVTRGPAFSETVKRQVRTQENKCAYCLVRQPPRAEVDHIKPRAKGGSGARSNAQLTCRDCNRSKGANTFPKHLPWYKKVWYVLKSPFRWR